MKYSASTNAFYHPNIGVTPPGDAVDISDDVYQGLRLAESQGGVVKSGPDGHPIAVMPPPGSTPIDYVPNWLVRQRLEADGLWYQAVAAMSPPRQIRFATLEVGLDPADRSINDLLKAIGADPAVILAPVN